MPRGLGKIQRALLQYFNQHPKGGGTISNWTNTYTIMRGFKEQYYPELYGPDSPELGGNWLAPSYHPGAADMPEEAYRKATNKARVSIHLAIKGLIRRGYLRTETETGEYGGWRATRAYITEEGKKAIL